jgi:hypothetical protein
MIDTLALHGIQAEYLVPSLMTTHTVANPEYDPSEARKQSELRDAASLQDADENSEDLSSLPQTSPKAPESTSPRSPSLPSKPQQTTAKVLEDTSAAALPGVSTHLSAADEKVTLDIRWTVLCDLFLILVADSVYDARSRVLLENVALKLGLGWVDVVKFERRVTEALDIQEEVENLESKGTIEDVKKSSKKRRYMMLGLATLGVWAKCTRCRPFLNTFDLSIYRWWSCYRVVCGSACSCYWCWSRRCSHYGRHYGHQWVPCRDCRGGGDHYRRCIDWLRYRRERYGKKNAIRKNIRYFTVAQQQACQLHSDRVGVNRLVWLSIVIDLFKTLFPNRFMSGAYDDVRLPFSVLDPVVGDVFSVLWEPEMIRETGSALKILTTEVLTQIGQTVLQATVMTALMSALQWPISTPFGLSAC